MDYTKDVRYQKVLIILVEPHRLESPNSGFFNASGEQK